MAAESCLEPEKAREAQMSEEGEEAPPKGKERSMTRKEGRWEKGTKSGRFFEETVNIPTGRSKSGKSTLPEPKYSKSKDATMTVMKRFRVT